MYIYVYVSRYVYIYTRLICRQEPFRSLRVHQYSSDQKKILKDQSAYTNARVMRVTYRLWIPILINRVTDRVLKLRSGIFDQSIDRSCFALWELNTF